MIFHRNGACSEFQLHDVKVVLIKEMLNFVNCSECLLIPSADAAVLSQHRQVKPPFLVSLLPHLAPALQPACIVMYQQ